jgi:hypothetical protein
VTDEHAEAQRDRDFAASSVGAAVAGAVARPVTLMHIFTGVNLLAAATAFGRPWRMRETQSR